MTKVREEMSRKVAFATETDDLRQAYDSMIALNIRHVPVVSNGKVVGMLSDRDVLLHAKAEKNGEVVVPKIKLAEVMSTPVYVCGVNDSIGSIADQMIEKKIDALPVVDKEQKLIGIITSTDLLRLLKDEDWEITLPLPFRFEPLRLFEFAS